MASSYREALKKALDLIRGVATGRMRAPPWLALWGQEYESPLEKDFSRHVVKYLADEVVVEPQVWVCTNVGRFRVDFVLSFDGRRVGIECDGRAYHDETRDRTRDFAILETGALDVVYRVRGQDAFWRIEDVLFLLAELEPEFFSEKGVDRLRWQASRRARDHAVFDEELVTVRYEWDEYDNGPEEDRTLDFQVFELRLAIRRRHSGKDAAAGGDA